MLLVYGSFIEIHVGIYCDYTHLIGGRNRERFIFRGGCRRVGGRDISEEKTSEEESFCGRYR